MQTIQDKREAEALAACYRLLLEKAIERRNRLTKPEIKKTSPHVVDSENDIEMGFENGH